MTVIKKKMCIVLSPPYKPIYPKIYYCISKNYETVTKNTNTLKVQPNFCPVLYVDRSIDEPMNYYFSQREKKRERKRRNLRLPWVVEMQLVEIKRVL